MIALAALFWLLLAALVTVWVTSRWGPLAA